ncbi:hypothetical protein NFI96_026114 [Prochilodus magdalenae]|nr:hypothetical protein NFI96_026114 [Prochilodus magdalenae]
MTTVVGSVVEEKEGNNSGTQWSTEEPRPRLLTTSSFIDWEREEEKEGDNSTLIHFRLKELEHPHTVPADGAVGVEVEGHQAFWTCENRLVNLVLTTVPPHTDSLGVSTKTKACSLTQHARRLVPADGAVGVEVEGHQAFWTCENRLVNLVLTTVPPHTDSLGISTKTKTDPFPRLHLSAPASRNHPITVEGVLEQTTVAIVAFSFLNNRVPHKCEDLVGGIWKCQSIQKDFISAFAIPPLAALPVLPHGSPLRKLSLAALTSPIYQELAEVVGLGSGTLLHLHFPPFSLRIHCFPHSYHHITS